MVLALYEAVPEELALRGYMSGRTCATALGLVVATLLTTALFPAIGVVIESGPLDPARDRHGRIRPRGVRAVDRRHRPGRLRAPARAVRPRAHRRTADPRWRVRSSSRWRSTGRS
ncbi:hypothetical protein [Clavibacter zhangzhiyongii]|uniref:hypothetical protein n=1 Tax=Clavibacter zhangzhiyongii TaxID=2768071 RepID=UPI0039DF849E